MTVIELTTDIDARIERVFDLARDVDFHARSMAYTGERAIAGRMTGRIELGDTITWRARHFGRWWSLTSRVTSLERPVRFEDVQERGPFACFHHEHRFESRGNGTGMHDRWEHRSPLGPVGRLVDRMVLARYMRSLLVRRNRAIKHAAEAQRGACSDCRRLLVLYDADCGICTRSARLLRRLDRDRRLQLVRLQAAGRITSAPLIEVLREALHVRDEMGRWISGSAASIRIGQAVPLLRPMALLAGLPGARRLADPAYRLVAGNRHRLSRLLGDDACPVRRTTP